MAPLRLIATPSLLLTSSVFVAVATAHGGDVVGMNMSSGVAVHGMHAADQPKTGPSFDDGKTAPSYWGHPEHVSLMYAHIFLMVLAWVILLPVAVMLSIGKSRLTILVQLAFLAINGLGVFLSIVYDAQTPDLYENNSHHKAGWAITWIAVIWVVVGLVNNFTQARLNVNRHSSEPMTATNMEQYQRLHRHSPSSDGFRSSHESGRSSDRHSALLASQSRRSSWLSDADQSPYSDGAVSEEDEHENNNSNIREKYWFLRTPATTDRLLSRYLSKVRLSSRAAMTLLILNFIVERTMLVQGFVGITTGAIVYGGIGRSGQVFNVLAHMIKGGIFFWYGLLTFGRWLGCFADFGWAWNVKPDSGLVGVRKARMPSAEFIESFVICLYGGSNVFLEHLAAWGHPWSPMDLEHVSITIMFFGGGLLGMLIESKKMRRLLNNVLASTEYNDSVSHASAHHHRSFRWTEPDSYTHSLNPLPLLVIFLLGVMMSAHSQHSMVSAAIHRQWGTLFTGFAASRAITYALLWLKPPTSYLATRPPSEVVASFCLISGGLIFMASNWNTVQALEYYDLDAMFVFTVVMGFTGLLMAWQMICVAIKAWASRRNSQRNIAMNHAAARNSHAHRHVQFEAATLPDSPA